MRTTLRTATLLGLFTLAALPSLASAQRGRGGIRGRGAAAMAAVEDASILGTMLTHKEELKLSAEQITKLRQLDSATTAANAPTTAKLRALRSDSGAAGVRPLDMTQEQRAMARQKLQEAAPLLREIQERNAKAADEAKGLLSPEQRETLQRLVDEQAAGRGGRRRRP